MVLVGALRALGERLTEMKKIDQTSIALSPKEVQEVTGYKTATKQINALVVMDIPFKVRPNGSPFVARTAVEGRLMNTMEDQPKPILTPI